MQFAGYTAALLILRAVQPMRKLAQGGLDALAFEQIRNRVTNEFQAGRVCI